MHVRGIKVRKWKTNPNLNMWKANKQQTCETESQNHKYIYNNNNLKKKRSKTEASLCKETKDRIK